MITCFIVCMFMIINKVICYSFIIIVDLIIYVCVSVTFWGFVRNFEDEMGGFEKSAKTTHTSPCVPFQTKRPEDRRHGLLPRMLLPKLLRSIPPTPIPSLLLKI